MLIFYFLLNIGKSQIYRAAAILLNLYPINQTAYLFSINLIIRLNKLMRPTFNVHVVAMWKVSIFIVTNLNKLLWIWSQWILFFALPPSPPPPLLPFLYCMHVIVMHVHTFAIQMSNGEMSSNDLASVKINLIQWSIRMHFLQRQQKKIYIIWHTQKKTIENKRYKTKTQQNEDTTWIELLLFIQVFLGNEIVDTILMKLFEVFRLLFCCLFVGLENVCICRNAWNCLFYSYVNDQIWFFMHFVTASIRNTSTKHSKITREL